MNDGCEARRIPVTMLQYVQKPTSSLLTLVFVWLAAINLCQAQQPEESTELAAGDDLASYVSVRIFAIRTLCSRLTRIIQRPDIRAPLWNITKHDPSLIAPGYWFVSPYTDFENLPDRLEYTPYQVGSHIYDQNGVSDWYPRP